MGPGELAQDRSHWDSALSRLFEGALQFRGAGSGLTGKARVDKCLAAGVRVCGPPGRTTQPEHQCQCRDKDEQRSLHGGSSLRGIGQPKLRPSTDELKGTGGGCATRTARSNNRQMSLCKENQYFRWRIREGCDDRDPWVDPTSTYRSRPESAGGLVRKVSGSSPGAAAVRDRSSTRTPAAGHSACYAVASRASGYPLRYLRGRTALAPRLRGRGDGPVLRRRGDEGQLSRRGPGREERDAPVLTSQSRH